MAAIRHMYNDGLNPSTEESGEAPLLDYRGPEVPSDLPLLPVREKQVSYVPRFIVVLILWACVFSVIANAMLADDAWTTAMAVWGCAIAMALTDLWAKKREAAKGRS